MLQFVSGNFFKNNLKNGDFTFYNRFFIEKMPKLFQFFEKLTKVELPSFIEKFVYDELPDNYEYDYFKENPDKSMFHRTICYSLYDLMALLDNIDNLKKNQKKEIIKKYIPSKGKKPPELKEFEGKKQIYYFLETEL